MAAARRMEKDFRYLRSERVILRSLPKLVPERSRPAFVDNYAGAGRKISRNGEIEKCQFLIDTPYFVKKKRSGRLQAIRAIFSSLPLGNGPRGRRLGYTPVFLAKVAPNDWKEGDAFRSRPTRHLP